MHALDNLKCSDERTMMMLILNVYIHLFLYLYHGSKILFSRVRLIRGYGVAVCIIQAANTQKFPVLSIFAFIAGIQLFPVDLR